MNTKYAVWILVAILVVGGGVWAFKGGLMDNEGYEYAYNSTDTTDVSETSTSSEESMATTTAKTTPTPALKSFTLADVALHGDATSCFTAIDGNVYDLTAWISKHPGGQKAILGICGKDGSGAFNRKHGGAEKQALILASFKLGVLVN